LQENYQRLQAARDGNGAPLEVIPLPMPGRLQTAQGRLPASYTNFYIAKGFEIPARRITTRDEVSDALDEMLAAKTPYVLDVIIPYTEHVLPMIPTGHTFADTIYEE